MQVSTEMLTTHISKHEWKIISCVSISWTYGFSFRKLVGLKTMENDEEVNEQNIASDPTLFRHSF